METAAAVSAAPRTLATQELPKRQADLNFFDERLREMEVAVTRDPMRSKAARLRDELIRLERKQQMLSEELDGPQVRDGRNGRNGRAAAAWGGWWVVSHRPVVTGKRALSG